MKYNYDPKTKKYPYPEITDQHYLNVKKKYNYVFDEKYPYIDKSFGFRFKRRIVRILLYLMVFTMTRIKLGLRVIGKKNLRKNKKLINNGIITCSNHIHLWDFLTIMYILKPKAPYVLSWSSNINGSTGNLVRLIGGIPIPDNSIKGTLRYVKEMGSMLNNSGILHIYPEGSMWEYYKPVRPFKRGLAYFAIKFDKPILPFGFSFRRPNFIRRVFFRQIACITLNIGTPIFKNNQLEKEEQEKDLVIKAFNQVCNLTFNGENKNIYPPIFENNKRIDY